MEQPQFHLEGIVHTHSEEMEDFEGPLDVIFLLLSKNKVEIQDVSITAILDQYLAYLEDMKRLDMEVASSFITMASHLMLIKTKMLLSAAEQEEAVGELDLIRQSLLNRQNKEALDQIQLAAAALVPRNEIGRSLFVKEPEPVKSAQGYRYRHEPLDLLRALQMIAERNERRIPPPRSNFEGIVGREPYPVDKKAGEVFHRLILQGAMRLKQIFFGSHSRSEIVATFLALLELCKTNQITLNSEDASDDPVVTALPQKTGGAKEII